MFKYEADSKQLLNHVKKGSKKLSEAYAKLDHAQQISTELKHLVESVADTKARLTSMEQEGKKTSEKTKELEVLYFEIEKKLSNYTEKLGDYSERITRCTEHAETLQQHNDVIQAQIRLLMTSQKSTQQPAPISVAARSQHQTHQPTAFASIKDQEMNRFAKLQNAFQRVFGKK